MDHVGNPTKDTTINVEIPKGSFDDAVKSSGPAKSSVSFVLDGGIEAYESTPVSQGPLSGWRSKHRYPTYNPPPPTQTARAYEIKVLDSPEELLQSFKLRYEIFGALGYLQSFNRSGIEIDEYDAYAIPFGAFETSTGALIGTLRLITKQVQRHFVDAIYRILDEADDEELSRQVLLKTRRKPLPSIVSETVADCLDKFNPKRRPVKELSRLIVHPEHRGTGMARGLMEFGIAYAAIQSPCMILSGCLQSHVNMNARYGYKVLPGTDLDLNDCVGQIASTIVCNTAVLPQPTREHVDKLLRRMRSGASECVLEMNNGSRAVYHFANHGAVHANFGTA